MGHLYYTRPPCQPPPNCGGVSRKILSVRGSSWQGNSFLDTAGLLNIWWWSEAHSSYDCMYKTSTEQAHTRQNSSMERGGDVSRLLKELLAVDCSWERVGQFSSRVQSLVGWTLSCETYTSKSVQAVQTILDGLKKTNKQICVGREGKE